METIVPLLLAAFLLRLASLPLTFAGKILPRAAAGFLCLIILNRVSGITGLYLPVNGVTVLLAGTLVLPGIGILAALELFF